MQHCGYDLCNIVFVICATLWLLFVQRCDRDLCNIAIVICATLWLLFVPRLLIVHCEETSRPGAIVRVCFCYCFTHRPSNPPQSCANTPFLPEMFRKYSTGILDLKRKRYFPEASATTMQKLKKGPWLPFKSALDLAI